MESIVINSLDYKAIHVATIDAITHSMSRYYSRAIPETDRPSLEDCKCKSTISPDGEYGDIIITPHTFITYVCNMHIPLNYHTSVYMLVKVDPNVSGNNIHCTIDVKVRSTKEEASRYLARLDTVVPIVNKELPGKECVGLIRSTIDFYIEQSYKLDTYSVAMEGQGHDINR